MYAPSSWKLATLFTRPLRSPPLLPPPVVASRGTWPVDKRGSLVAVRQTTAGVAGITLTTVWFAELRCNNINAARFDDEARELRPDKLQHGYRPDEVQDWTFQSLTPFTPKVNPRRNSVA